MRASRTSRREVGIELTPLIDIVFLLLIFFMVSTTLIEKEALQVKLPEAKGTVSMPETAPLVISVSRLGDYAINGQVIAGKSTSQLVTALDMELASITYADRGNIDVVVRADARATHQSVISVLDACARLGLIAVNLASAPDPQVDTREKGQ